MSTGAEYGRDSRRLERARFSARQGQELFLGTAGIHSSDTGLADHREYPCCSAFVYAERNSDGDYSGDKRRAGDVGLGGSVFDLRHKEPNTSAKNDFFILGCASLAFSVHVVFDGFFGIILYMRNSVSLEGTAMTVSGWLYYLPVIACAIVLIFIKSSNTPIRLAAAAILLAIGAKAAYLIISPEPDGWIFTYVSMREVINACVDAAKYLAFAFLLGAVSFSKPKPQWAIPAVESKTEQPEQI